MVEKYFDNIVEVCLSVDGTGNILDGTSCTCEWFLRFRAQCGHILCVRHLMHEVDVFTMTAEAFPKNKPKTMAQKRAFEANK